MSKGVAVVAYQRSVTYHYRSIRECRIAYGYRTDEEFLIVLANNGVHFDGYTTFDYDVTVTDEQVAKIENKYKYKNRKML